MVSSRTAMAWKDRGEDLMNGREEEEEGARVDIK